VGGGVGALKGRKPQPTGDGGGVKPGRGGEGERVRNDRKTGSKRA